MDAEVEDLGIYLKLVADAVEAIDHLVTSSIANAERYPCVSETASPLLEGDEASKMIAVLNATHEAVTRRLLNLLREASASQNAIGDPNP